MLAVLLLNRMTTKSRIAAKQKDLQKTKTEPLQTPDDSLGACCRTCLSTEDLEPIFSSKEAEKKKSHELNVVTGLEIKMNDGLSQNMCKNCLSSLKTALQFRRCSRKAEKKLLDMAITGKPKKKNKIRKKEIKSQKIKVKDESNDTLDASAEYDQNEYQNEFSYENDDFDDELYDDVKDTNIVKIEYDPKENDKQPRVKKKRTTLPNASSYKCPICHKEFRMKATYKAHLRFHTNYCVCETCGKRCRNNNQLQEHKRARHGLGRIHKCAYCEYSSATKEALTIHERRHTGERPYVCDHCGATFHRRSNLVQHIAIHLPEKNFQCDLCPKKLKSRKFLQIHKHNAHTGRKYGYLCPVCEHRFEKPNKVRAHTRRVHGLQDGDHGPIVRVQL